MRLERVRLQNPQRLAKIPRALAQRRAHMPPDPPADAHLASQPALPRLDVGVGEYRRRMRAADEKGVRPIRRLRPRLVLRARAPSDSGQRPQSRPAAGVRFAGERDDHGQEDAARAEAKPGGKGLTKLKQRVMGWSCVLTVVRLSHTNPPHPQLQQITRSWRKPLTTRYVLELRVLRSPRVNAQHSPPSTPTENTQLCTCHPR